MNLIVDLGNTLAKIAIFNNDGGLTISKNYDCLSSKEVMEMKQQFPEIKFAILSSVIELDDDLVSSLKQISNKLIILDYKTEIPIENLYHTKETLGNDRVAAVVGANNIFPNTNVLVVDSGTAITYDFINSSRQYAGGNISPGIEMRFKALNTFAKKLPLLSKEEEYEFIGNSTDSALISGVQQGVVFEVEGYINQLKETYDDLKVILTGGDCFFFEKKLKNTIFVEPNLVLLGLNIILKYNVESS